MQDAQQTLALEKSTVESSATVKFAGLKQRRAVCGSPSQITNQMRRRCICAVICDGLPQIARHRQLCRQHHRQPSPHLCSVSNNAPSESLSSAPMYKGPKGADIHKRDIFLLGTTTIKNKLQEGIQDAIHTLYGRTMKVRLSHPSSLVKHLRSPAQV